MARLLIVDDDPKICLVLSRMVKIMGHEAVIANTVKDALNLSAGCDVDLILLDLDLPDGNGLQILPDLLNASSEPEVIIISGTGDIRGAELAFKHGAWDYVRKPFVFNEVSLSIKRALQYRQGKNIVKIPVALNRLGIIGDSSAIQRCLEDVARASVTDAGVLVCGETGTGKELFAKAIHVNSARSSGPFVVVDCGALPESLIESILFGHEKGAFTGATKNQDGLIQQVDGGTLFFDEIGELPVRAQTALLRTLQEHKVRPLGGKTETPVNFKLIAATNRDLDSMVEEKTFRKDLLFRIRAIEISLPPLRERTEDIQQITVTKIHEFCRRYAIATKGISPEFQDVLTAYNWPGNVRELLNVLEYALASARRDSVLFPKHLPPQCRTARLDFNSIEDLKSRERQSAPEDNDQEFAMFFDYREKTEKAYLQMLLDKAEGNRKEACRLSGLSQSRLYELLKKYELSRFNR